MDSKQIAIVGGGPAGLASAIFLAKQGWQITLFERKTFPHNKVCGEFISPESWYIFKQLDLSDEIYGTNPPSINQLLIADSQGTCLSARLKPLHTLNSTAFGLSRETLDTLLYEKAKSLGIDIKTEYSVYKTQTEGDRVNVAAVDLPTGKSSYFTCQFAIYATGRQLVSPKNTRIKKSNKNQLFGIKAHFENVRLIEDNVELHSFENGYLGLANIDQNLTNLCFVIPQKILSEYRGDIDSVVENIIEQSPLLQERFREANKASPWYTTGPLQSGLKRFYEDRCFYVGDSCGAIEPLSGDGITMALTGAYILSNLLNQMEKNDFSIETAGMEYEYQIQQLFSSPIRFGKFLGYMATNPIPAAQLIRFLRFLPSLLDIFISQTRIPTSRISLSYQKSIPLS